MAPPVKKLQPDEVLYRVKTKLAADAKSQIDGEDAAMLAAEIVRLKALIERIRRACR